MKKVEVKIKYKPKAGDQTQQRKRKDSIQSLDDYCLNRLFDEEGLYYTPMDELLKRYKKRDLIPGRMFNLGKKYGAYVKSRIRVINAPTMQKAGQRSFGNENFYVVPPKVYYCSTTNAQNSYENKINNNKKLTENSIDESGFSSDEDDDHKINYDEWLKNRKKLRSGLDKLDLDYEYLRRKKNLTEVEQRVLKKLTCFDKEIQTDPEPEKGRRSKSSSTPQIKYPTPLAMEQIEIFLAENKWRLVDLFKDLDKNKDWKVYKKDFIRECKKGRLDISDAMIDELLTALSDSNSKSNKINYKALAKGRTSNLFDRRSQLRESRESLVSDEFIPTYVQNEMNKKNKKTPTLSPEESHGRRSSSKASSKSKSPTDILVERKKSGKSIISSYEDFTSESKRNYENYSELSSHSNNYLQLPKIDTKPGHYPYNSNSKIIEIKAKPSFKERSVSAASPSSFNKFSREIIKRNDPENPKNELYQKRKFVKELRNRDQYELEKCIEKTGILYNTDPYPLETESFSINLEQKKKQIIRGLTRPTDKASSDILGDLLKKSTKQKEQAKKLYKEEKQRKKNLKTKMLNKKITL